LQLPGVHFGHQDLVVAAQQLAQVLRHRPDVADVDVADVVALGRARLDRLLDRAEGRAPADHRQLAHRLPWLTS
jgi:hypothetical protein